MKNLLLMVALCATIGQAFAQANCNATAPVIQPNATSPVVCLLATTPVPTLTDSGTVLPDLEYLLISNTQLIGSSPKVIAANASGQFNLLSYAEITNGDEVCVIPVRFNIGQIRDLVDKIINGSYSAGLPCCNLVESLLDGVCEEFDNQGITGASSVTNLEAILKVVEVLSGEELSVDGFVNTIGTLNQYGGFLPIECGGSAANVPVCFAIDATSKACYIAGFATSATNTVIIDSALANGTATVTAIGGSAPYSYSWSNSATTSTVNNLVVGAYTVTITDNNACAVTEVITVTDSCALLTYELIVIPVSCFGGNDALVQVKPVGGTPNYLVTPSVGAAQTVSTGNRATFISLTAGTYNYTVSDNGGCATQLSVAIANPDSITLIVADLQDTLDLNLTDSLEFAIDTLFGGDFPINLQWDFDNGSNSAAGGGKTAYTTAGTYQIEVSAIDARNCRKNFTQTLVVIGGTGINELSKNQLVKLYPNPTNSIVTVEWNKQLTNAQFILYNTIGQVVINGYLNQNNTQLDLSELPMGVYNFQVIGTEINKKIVLVE
jgi:hypothetical protein